MKKFSVFGAIASVFCAGAGWAAYPIYQTAQPGAQMQVMQPIQMVQQQPQVIVPVNAAAAAQPTRITGTLPRVGSNATNAGRQYYQPADYDRLADSGLYIGLGVAYSAAVNGSMKADYAGETDDFLAPGAFRDAAFNSDTVIPLQLSVGAAINNDVRVDFSYNRFGGIEYPSVTQTSNGSGGFADTSVSGGAVTANAVMLNLYYNIDSYTGYLMGGSLRPYIGVGAGLSINTIADYVVYDNNPYYIFEDLTDPAAAGQTTTITDIAGYHNGGTKESIAYMLEAGITTELSGGLKLDFFARYTGLGAVQTSGSVVASETDWIGDGAGGETPYDNVSHFTNWTESASLSTIDVGARLRLQF